VTPILPETRSRESDSSDRPEKPRGWWPQRTTPMGAVLYGAIGSLAVWLLIELLSHIRIYVSWR
jgi:hypothetical protein